MSLQTPAETTMKASNMIPASERQFHSPKP
jgi:hypothetical protein